MYRLSMKSVPSTGAAKVALKNFCCRPAIQTSQRGFTLVEVMIVMALAGILIVAGMGALFSLDLCSRRTGDYNAALAVVEAKIEDIRAATYDPPNSPWLPAIYSKTESASVALDKAGVSFQVPGTLVSTFEPWGIYGHRVTVTGTFAEPRGSISVTLQTVINQYSCGRQ
jgi:prepilin-type N-terminal cleavage/methylation domain-containing protein